MYEITLPAIITEARLNRVKTYLRRMMKVHPYWKAHPVSIGEFNTWDNSCRIGTEDEELGIEALELIQGITMLVEGRALLTKQESEAIKKVRADYAAN